MKYLILILSFVLIFFQASAQETGSRKTLSLNDCINIGLSKNFDIQLTKQQINAANSQLTGAFGNYLPSIDFNLGYNRTFNPREAPKNTTQLGSSTNAYSMSVLANYPIFDGFGREAYYSKSKDLLEATKSGAKQTIQDVKIEIIRRFLKVTRNAQVVRIRQENLELGKTELVRAQARFDAGVAPITIVFSQEADLGQREFELVNSINDLNISKAELLAFMGLAPDLQMEFLESSIPTTIREEDITAFRRETGSYNAVIDATMKRRDDYFASDLQIKAAESTVKQAYTGYMPKLGAQGGWSWNNSEWSGFSENGLARTTIGLNLSVPVFENFQTNVNVQSANYQLEQKQIEQKRLEQMIRQQVQTAFFTLEATEKQLDITRRSLLSAEKNFESSKERFQVGTANIAEYLLANNQLISAQINRVTAVYAYIQAQRELQYSSGILE